MPIRSKRRNRALDPLHTDGLRLSRQQVTQCHGMPAQRIFDIRKRRLRAGRRRRKAAVGGEYLGQGTRGRRLRDIARPAPL